MISPCIPIEKHPLSPFLPDNAKILMLGSFPPKQDRWSMNFFYPNFQNDMWRIMGYLFFENKNYFVKSDDFDKKLNGFDKQNIIDFCTKYGIALYDTALEVKRLQDNASDKFLEIVKITNLQDLLEKIPSCNTIVTTGQKATDVIISTFSCTKPSIGDKVNLNINNRLISFWRMPSTSRAYPLSLEKKADYYKKMFIAEKIL